MFTSCSRHFSGMPEDGLTTNVNQRTKGEACFFGPKSSTTSIGMDFEGALLEPRIFKCSNKTHLEVALLSTLVPSLSTESSRRFVNALAPEASEEAKEVGDGKGCFAIGGIEVGHKDMLVHWQKLYMGYICTKIMLCICFHLCEFMAGQPTPQCTPLETRPY